MHRSHLTRPGIFVALAGAALLLALSLASCDDDGGPTSEGGGGDVTLTLEAEIGDLTGSVEREQFLDTIAELLASRVQAFGAEAGNFEIDDENARLTVTLEGGISNDQAREILLAPGQVDLKQPRLNEDGDMVCRTQSGDEFAITSEAIAYDTSDANARPLPRCADADGRSGEIVWASPASPGEEAPVGLVMNVSQATVDRSQAPAVFVEVDPNGTIALQQLTEALVGMPLGIFVDGELMAGPTVEESITDGLLVIAGLTLPEADILAAQLGSGSLPTTLTEVGPDSMS